MVLWLGVSAGGRREYAPPAGGRMSRREDAARGEAGTSR